ncbi:MAG: alpha/beta fold hydrolase [Acidobacteria bacterium]|nr:alpha/beta fold hydrolase [Acidobacteriota bacterium]
MKLTVARTATVLALLTLAVAAPEAQGQEIEWGVCAEAPHDDAQCGHLTLPLDPTGGDAGTIDIQLGRILAPADSEPRTLLWYLPGGPGDAGVETLGRLHAIFGEIGVDIYSIDHRGVGGSELLRCPDQEAEDSPEGRELSEEEWPECVTWIQTNRTDLPYLTTDAAAHDVAAAINTVTGPDDRVILFGASYGTYWANRYLTHYPDQVDGVVLDGIVPADWTFAEFDASLDATGRALLDRCARDEECGSYLGPDPAAKAEELPDRFAEGHCPDLSSEIDGRTLRLVFGNMLMSGPDVWPYLPALIYRIDKCRVRDLEATGALFENLFESGEVGEPESHSPVLQRHVSMSELWPEDGPTVESLEAAIGRSTMTTAVSSSFASTYPGWPRYARPADWGQLANYTGPLLLLHGGLDPTMPVDRLADLRDHFSAAGQEFVLFPDAGHVTLNGNPCARAMYFAFIAAPGTPVDRTCVTDVAGLSLTAPETDTPLFGTDDFWGESTTTMEVTVLAINILIAAAVAGMVVWVSRWLRRRRARNA